MTNKRIYYMVSDDSYKGDDDYKIFKIIGNGKAQSVHNPQIIETVELLKNSGYIKKWVNA